MNKSFYQNCILEDRRTRKFQDYSQESWYNEFIKLKDDHFLESKDFGENGLWWYNLGFEEEDNRTTFLGLKWRNVFPKLNYYKDYIKSLMNSKEILDLFCEINPYIFCGFLYGYKYSYYKVSKIHTAEYIYNINLPLIRFMDYFLEKGAFMQLAFTMERLEDEFIISWLEITKTEIRKALEKNNPDIIYFLSKIPIEIFKELIKKEDMQILKNSTPEAVFMLLECDNVPREYIYDDSFLETFKEFELESQIYISELMEKLEYDWDYIKKLHKALNIKYKFKYPKEFFYSSFQMTSSSRTSKLMEMIENSSYFRKNNIKESEKWNKLKDGFMHSTSNRCFGMEVYDYYSEIMDLYHKAREYATSSIVNSLYPLNKCSGKITYMDAEKYNILARVRTTLWEADDLETTFKIRTFCSFSILTEKNFSHFPGNVLYGYFTNVTKESIAHISPVDSLSSAGAKYEEELTRKLNKLLDIEDLNQKTYECETYNQLCIRTKNKNGEILWPDCIICIDEIDEESQKVADELSLGILVLKKNPDTIENNKDIYEDLQ